MELILDLYGLMDRLLMPFYRFPDNPLHGYALGTLLLSFLTVLIGHCTASIAWQANRRMISQDVGEIRHYEALSIEALRAGDKPAFKACNGIANASYGKTFFSQIALAAAMLWPVCIALGWMQYRFAGVSLELPFSLPFTGDTAGYLSTFLLCYISVRVVVAKGWRSVSTKAGLYAYNEN